MAPVIFDCQRPPCLRLSFLQATPSTTTQVTVWTLMSVPWGDMTANLWGKLTSAGTRKGRSFCSLAPPTLLLKFHQNFRSFRCEKIRCGAGQELDLSTGTCRAKCRPGFESVGSGGSSCRDVDECQVILRKASFFAGFNFFYTCNQTGVFLGLIFPN